MIGIGIDLCSISRIDRISGQNPNFFKRYYSESELLFLEKQGNCRPESAAAMFAAKEAFLKAIGKGINGEVALSDISVEHEANGRPFYFLKLSAEKALREADAKKVHLSLTHENDTAAAVCVIE